jgi:hypothetical protein
MISLYRESPDSRLRDYLITAQYEKNKQLRGKQWVHDKLLRISGSTQILLAKTAKVVANSLSKRFRG